MPNCDCTMWCRTDIQFRDGKPLPFPNHHPRCVHYNDSLIDVWRVSFGGASYVTDREPEADAVGEGETVTREKMHREVYENLPEFVGF